MNTINVNGQNWEVLENSNIESGSLVFVKPWVKRPFEWNSLGSMDYLCNTIRTVTTIHHNRLLIDEWTLHIDDVVHVQISIKSNDQTSKQTIPFGTWIYVDGIVDLYQRYNFGRYIRQFIRPATVNEVKKHLALKPGDRIMKFRDTPVDGKGVIDYVPIGTSMIVKACDSTTVTCEDIDQSISYLNVMTCR